MSAPNLGEALKQVTEQATDRNPPFRFSLDSDGRIVRILIASHDALGDFGRIYELLAQAVLFRLIESFLEYAENKAEAVGSIIFSCRIFDEELISSFSRANWLRVEHSAHETSISLPAVLRASPNPSVFDGPVGTGRSVTAESDQAINAEFDIELKRAIDASLQLENRTVQLDEVAQQFGLSPRTVLRKIAESGSTLRQISIDRRMARACELLGDPSIKVSDVSSAAGYSDPSSFVRAFKRKYGTSPHRWRRQVHPEMDID
nr:AraC family transcriptional regulator [Qipengyuania xiapuensis]